MKTINFKNVVVVAMNNCALITNNDKKVSTVMNATDNTVASLQVMKAFLQSVPTNEELVEEPYQLVLGEKSAIKGFATGTHLQYIRTGANATGKEFTEEQFELIKEVATLLAERGLNVKVTTDKFISYKDKQGRAIIDFAWNTLKLEISKANEQTQQKPQRPVAPAKQTAVVDPRVAKLQELMTKALDEGDLDKYDQLEERLNRIQAPVVEETNEVEVPNEEEVEDPTAGSDEIEL